MKSAGEIKKPCLDFEFKSPACIQYRNSKVYEMFPHREAVFHSLLSKWNAVSPEEMKMNIERDEMARYMVEKPLAYETHSVVVNTVFDKVKGHPRPIMRQGFTGPLPVHIHQERAGGHAERDCGPGKVCGVQRGGERGRPRVRGGGVGVGEAR